MTRSIFCIKLFFKLLFSPSFFIAYTIKKGTTLTHYEKHFNFAIADFDQCFINTAELLNEIYPNICHIKVVRPPALPMTTITKAEA